MFLVLLLYTTWIPTPHVHILAGCRLHPWFRSCICTVIFGRNDKWLCRELLSQTSHYARPQSGQNTIPLAMTRFCDFLCEYRIKVIIIHIPMSSGYTLHTQTMFHNDIHMDMTNLVHVYHKYTLIHTCFITTSKESD